MNGASSINQWPTRYKKTSTTSGSRIDSMLSPGRNRLWFRSRPQRTLSNTSMFSQTNNVANKSSTQLRLSGDKKPLQKIMRKPLCKINKNSASRSRIKTVTSLTLASEAQNISTLVRFLIKLAAKSLSVTPVSSALSLIYKSLTFLRSTLHVPHYQSSQISVLRLQKLQSTTSPT